MSGATSVPVTSDGSNVLVTIELNALRIGSGTQQRWRALMDDDTTHIQDDLHLYIISDEEEDERMAGVFRRASEGGALKLVSVEEVSVPLDALVAAAKRVRGHYLRFTDSLLMLPEVVLALFSEVKP